MIRIAIVEDEDYYVSQLTGYLKEYQKSERTEFDIPSIGTVMRLLRNIRHSLT